MFANRARPRGRQRQRDPRKSKYIVAQPTQIKASKSICEKKQKQKSKHETFFSQTLKALITKLFPVPFCVAEK